MSNSERRMVNARAQIRNDYGIELDEAHLKSVVTENDRILKVARNMLPNLSFDSEPADFSASLVRLRD